MERVTYAVDDYADIAARMRTVDAPAPGAHWFAIRYDPVKPDLGKAGWCAVDDRNFVVMCDIALCAVTCFATEAGALAAMHASVTWTESVSDVRLGLSVQPYAP